MFRTVQSMTAPPKAIVPAFSTLVRGPDLFSSMTFLHVRSIDFLLGSLPALHDIALREKDALQFGPPGYLLA